MNFRYLYQQQIQALKIQGSYYKKVILNRNSKQELQWWLQMVVTWFNFTVKCWYKQMGCSMSRDINMGEMVKGGTAVTHTSVGTESSKISTFDFQQTKIMESSWFSKRKHHCTTLSCKNRGIRKPNITEIKQSNLAVSLETPITITAEYLPSSLNVDADL